MARPRRCRRVCAEPDYGSFRPDGIPGGENITLTVDEYEVIRLIDLEKLTHEQCAKRMDISRTTVTEIYESAREKIADSIVNGKILLISGGDYRLCDGSAIHFCRKRCGRPDGLPHFCCFVQYIRVYLMTASSSPALTEVFSPTSSLSTLPAMRATTEVSIFMASITSST